MAEAPERKQQSGIPSIGGGLAAAAAIVAFGFVGSRLLGILRTVAIADAFGSSPDLAAYNVAFRIPDLIFQVLAGATLGSAFIPVFARVFRNEGSEAAWRLASNILTIVTAATAVLCVIALIVAPWLVPLTAPGLGEDIGRQAELTDKAVSLSRLMLVSPLLFAVSGMITGILNGRQRFLLSALAPIGYNAAIIIGAVFLSGPWGIEGLAVGVIAGASLHLVVQLPGLVQERMRFRPTLNFADGATREVGRLMGPRAVGLAAGQFNFFITTYFASKISSSAINDLTFAWTIAVMPLGLFGMALATAVFPRLAEQVAGDDHGGMATTISRVFRIIMFTTIPAAIGLALVASPVTTLLLQRGEFGADNAAIVSSTLVFYSLGIIPLAGIEIHSRAFYALGDTRTPVGLAVFAVGVNLLLSALLWFDYQHEGLATAVAIAAWIEWALLLALYVRQTHIDIWPDLWAISRFALCAALMALTVGLALVAFEDPTGGQVNALLIAGAAAVAGACVYAGLARWLNVQELTYATSGLASRLGRRPVIEP
jgi:putative peptidoglycan lipid II flippase